MTAEETFWNWFNQHEMELAVFEADQDKLFEQLAAELHRIDPNLTFEFGPRETKREFVISAGGIKNSFPAVVSLANVAPSFERWRVTAFSSTSFATQRPGVSRQTCRPKGRKVHTAGQWRDCRHLSLHPWLSRRRQ